MARRIIGMTFIVAAIIGLIFSLAGVIFVDYWFDIQLSRGDLRVGGKRAHHPKSGFNH
jgi:Na+-driven multidrug efflux pump